MKVSKRVDITKRSKVKVNEGFDITEMSIVVIGSMSLEGQSQVSSERVNITERTGSISLKGQKSRSVKGSMSLTIQKSRSVNDLL